MGAEVAGVAVGASSAGVFSRLANFILGLARF